MEAARELNITRAAENLHIAQPPLSRQIHQLEEELGVELFERKKKKLQLTEVGQLLLHRGDQIVTLVEKAEDEIRAFGKGVTGTLYLGTVEGSAPKMISQWVAEFSCRYPEVQYNLWNGSSDDVISRLSKGLCDLAVIAAPYDTERWEGIPVGSEPWAALIPHDHPLAKAPGDFVSLSDLAGEPLIIPSRKSRAKEIRGWFEKIEEEPKAIESEYTNISLINKYRLGIRNTFNIASKFLLLFAVFFFMSSAILAEYASFQMSEEESTDEGYSIGFTDLSENRILINKKDRTYFTEEDYEKIKTLPNIDYVVEDDVFIDSGVPIANNDRSFFGNLLDINNFKGDLTYGRVPENENEIILKINENNFYVKEEMNELLNKTYSLLKSSGYNSWTDERVKELIIVGIQTYKDSSYNCKFYVSKSVLDSLRSNMNKNYSKMKLMLNNKYVDYTIEPNDNVESGKAIVDDELKYQFKNNKITNQPIYVYVDNIYYKGELDLTVSRTYTKSNFKRTLGLDKYDNNRYKIFINTNDYNSLFDKPSYQSSVYVEDTKLIDETMSELENLGVTPKKVTDFKVNQGEIYKRIIKIIKVVVTIVLLIVLFFISYLIIKIILKSRNIYYTTLRILGATYKNVRRILDIELFANSTLAYIALMVFIKLVNMNVINLEYIAKLSEFLSIREYAGMYIILIVISRLISIKFARKLFKSTAINTYNEEV